MKPLHQKSIEIPTRDGSEVVEVFLDELPEDAEEICEILVAEEASIELFHQFALEYYKRGQKHAFIVLVKRGLYEAKNRKSSSGPTQAKLNALLAAHYIAEGVALSPSEKKKCAEYLEEATTCLNEAEKRCSGPNQPEEVSIRKGLLLLAKNMIEPAGLIFKFCLEKSSTSSSPAVVLAAQLGQACFYYLSGNFRAALTSFQAILRVNPQFNEIRAAIGYCFLQLGYKEMSLKAFTRVLQVDPKNESAMLAVGFLKLDQEKDLQVGLLEMKKVFELNRSNAVAQIHLANHFFFKGDFQKAKTLADGAMENAPNDKIKAEAFFICAKINHMQGNFSEALGNYQRASKLSPNFLPALFGLGQCFLARGDFEGATMMFEKILELEPSCPEVIRLMALIQCCTKQPANFDASLITRATALFPNDELLLKCAAVVFESINPEKSLEFYMKSSADESQNFAVLNNFVVLKDAMKKTEKSVDLELLKRAQTLTNDRIFALYLKFNEARLLETFGDTVVEAEELYKEILRDNPNFVLAHLRLGLICFGRGQVSEATDHFKDVLGIDEKNRDAWNCLAAINLKQKALNPARKSFERVLQNIDKNDPYALVALGNIYVELARQDKSNKHGDEYHKRAGEFFTKALSADKGNVYAAQGIGLIFADRAQASEAKEVFTQVRAAQGTEPTADSTSNLAHALVEMEKYANAISLYSSVTEGKRISLLLFLGRARYLLALESADFKAADLGIEDARNALEILPNDVPLKFNLALLLQSRAIAIKKNDTPEASELLSSALDSLTEAEEILSSIKDGFDTKLVTSRLALSQSIRKDLENRANLNEKTLKDQTSRLEQLKLQREAAAQKELEIRLEREILERKRLEEIEQNRKELAAKMRETEEKVKASAIHQRKTGDDSDTESDGENLEKSKKRKKRAKTEVEAEDDETDGIVKSSRSRRSAKTSAPLLSKEFISSSDEDDDKAVIEE